MSNLIRFDEYSYKVPTWAACAINNGSENLTDEEETQLNDFLDSLPDAGQGSFDFGNNEPYFSYYNDVDNLGNDVYDAIYTVFYYED